MHGPPSCWARGASTNNPLFGGLRREVAAPPRLRGAYQGLFQGAIGAAALLAPAVGALVMGRYGSATLWTGCIGLGMVIAVGQLSLGALRRPAEMAT